MIQPVLAQTAFSSTTERLAPTAMLQDQWNMVRKLVANEIGAGP